MQVELKVTEWKVKPPKKNEIDSRIVGTYDIVCSGKTIGSESFNGDYDKEFKFSAELIKSIKDIEAKILEEVKTIIQ